MDYCPHCRRFLNGALTCAGCGISAEELQRQAAAPPGPGHRRRPGRSDEDTAERDVSGDATEEEYEPVVGHRRARGAAPRRTGPRRARSKRGRRILTGTLGVVLAAGALSLAQLAIEGPGERGATSVKEKESAIDFDGAPEASGRPAVPGDPGSLPEPGSTDTSGAPTPDDSGDPSASASEDPSASPTASGTDSPDPSDPGSHDPGGPTSGGGDPGPTGDPTSEHPPPADPTPTQEPDPEPSKTDECTPILWWCA